MCPCVRVLFSFIVDKWYQTTICYVDSRDIVSQIRFREIQWFEQFHFVEGEN